MKHTIYSGPVQWLAAAGVAVALACCVTHQTSVRGTALHEVAASEGMGMPVVARIKGRNEDLARQILKDAGLVAATSLQEAATKAVELSKGGA